MPISQNLNDIHSRIHEYEQKYHREKNSVTLLAVSKKQSIEKIQEAFAAGQHLFGENYLQEALTKIDFFQQQNIEWHFIGPIQSNKTKRISETFCWVHSVDSEKIAKRLNDQRPGSLPPLNICLEVNISAEQTKSGVSQENVFSLAKYCSTLPRLKLRGLMTIPAFKNSFEEQRKELHKLKLLYEKLKSTYQLDTLSMGMSDDLEAAVAEGATMVRIGTAIFGKR